MPISVRTYRPDFGEVEVECEDMPIAQMRVTDINVRKGKSTVVCGFVTRLACPQPAHGTHPRWQAAAAALKALGQKPAECSRCQDGWLEFDSAEAKRVRSDGLVLGFFRGVKFEAIKPTKHLFESLPLPAEMFKAIVPPNAGGSFTDDSGHDPKDG
jgi:hypothetical protein